MLTIAPTPAPPTGVIEMFAANSAPTGYLLCDGSAVSRTTYANLFAVIGTIWGAGDGSTTFNVPNFNAAVRFPIGFTSAGVLGGSSNALSNHNHDLQGHTHAHAHSPSGGGQFLASGTPSASVTATATNYRLVTLTTTDATGPSPNNTGTSGTGTDTRPPFASVVFIIKT